LFENLRWPQQQTIAKGMELTPQTRDTMASTLVVGSFMTALNYEQVKPCQGIT
jgi:hypothetical protein